MFAIVGDLGKLAVLLFLILACLGCGLVAFSGAGLETKFETELTEAETELTQAKNEELRRRAELTESEAELEKAKAEAEAVRSTTEELVKHSRLNRRILTFHTVHSQLTTALSIANIFVWLTALYLWRREEQ
jgi:ABC-type transport system involved in cytochrome bd biosynthesis fused ATPase/permease subunit